MNRVLIQYAARQDVEKGRTIRFDATAVDANIHQPTDSTLLQDGIRVITRLLQEGKSLDPAPEYRVVDHNRAADGRFARKANLESAKSSGVKDVMFAEKRGLRLLDMVKSLWVYKKLRNFRAGIEATISRLKRTFGLDRCTWSGWLGFRQYVWSAIVSFDVLVLGKLLAQPR